MFQLSIRSDDYGAWLAGLFINAINQEWFQIKQGAEEAGGSLAEEDLVRSVMTAAVARVVERFPPPVLDYLRGIAPSVIEDLVANLKAQGFGTQGPPPNLRLV